MTQKAQDPFDLEAQGSQAERIIAKFGGVPALCEALAVTGHPRNRSTIYKWLYRKSKSGHGGTGGIIPLDAMAAVLEAAKYAGIELTDDDWALS